MTSKQRAARAKFKAVVKEAAKLRKKNPSLSQGQAVKQAFAMSYGKGRKVSGSHKDTRSHNVNIRVVSGTGKLSKQQAKSYLQSKGINFSSDFHSLSHSQQSLIAEVARKAGYRKPRTASGSTARYFFKHLSGKIGSTLLIEKGESSRTKPKKIVRIERTKKGTFKKLRSIGAAPEFSDPDAAREIELYADNNSQLYYSRRLPILKNLYRKYKAGKYEVAKAAKLWLYYINDAMQRYHKEFGSRGDKWHELLSVHDRKLLADQYARNTLNEFEIGEFDHLK